MLTPAARASAGVANIAGAPSRKISPDDAGRAPARMFISVDLPAPLAPQTAWTSPLVAVKSTWSSARTPGNRRVSPRVSRSGMAPALLRQERGWQRGGEPVVRTVGLGEFGGGGGVEIDRRHDDRGRRRLPLEDRDRFLHRLAADLEPAGDRPPFPRLGNQLGPAVVIVARREGQLVEAARFVEGLVD